MKRIVITTIVFVASMLLLYVIGLFVMERFSYRFKSKPLPCLHVGESWNAELEKCTVISR